MTLNTTIVSDDSSEDIDETVKCSHKEEPFLKCNLCDTLGKEMKAIKQDLNITNEALATVELTFQIKTGNISK